MRLLRDVGHIHQQSSSLISVAAKKQIEVIKRTVPFRDIFTQGYLEIGYEALANELNLQAGAWSLNEWEPAQSGPCLGARFGDMHVRILIALRSIKSSRVGIVFHESARQHVCNIEA
jgi:hypothetical protein